MTVRPATGEDARAVAEVHVEGWRWAYRGQIPDAFIDGISVDEREVMWRDALDAGRAISVATDRGRIVGFAAIGPPDDDQAPSGTGELHAIYLTSAFAGLGVGRALLTHAAGASLLVLATSVDLATGTGVGATALACVRRAPCPVVVLPNESRA